MFQLIENPQNQVPMASYMRDHFKFAGVKSPERKAQSRTLLKESKGWSKPELFEMITSLYEKEQREHQYVAIDLADRNVKRFDFQDIQRLTQFVMQKSWWDSIDGWRKVFDDYIRLHPEEKQAVFELFFQNENFWMRRISIILQLTEKNELDEIMLTNAIENDIETDEFFIQKAIGWALRNYSKDNPKWVKHFILTHQNISNLAQKEGSKYL